jgi:hypothetical protein
MGRPVYLTILINILLLAFIQSLPLPETNDAEFCDGNFIAVLFFSFRQKLNFFFQ